MSLVRYGQLGWFRGALLVLLACGIGLAFVRYGIGQVGDEHPFPNRYDAPSLDGGVAWINTSGPIDLRQLRGKFVLLDFWTYCCINCMHILPELKKLERAYPNEVVVIGVHSGKFDAERDSENITNAVQRYEIEHPVVNDAEMAIWKKFEVNSWPTLVVIDPEGNVVVKNSGEVSFETLDKFFKEKLAYYRRNKLLDLTSLRFELAAYKAPVTPLRYPSKILADERTDRLYISDTNHNRIVVTTLEGKLIETIGSGQIGSADGAYNRASFDHPHGTALSGNVLYVADTENHLIRRVDLRGKRVTTLAGTGKQGHDWSGIKARPRQTGLNSPWALTVVRDELFIAMAGPHQIWSMPAVGGGVEIGPFAGNGVEDIVDGPHLPIEPRQLGFSSFAQPSGLSTDGEVLYVADSEGSSIRAVPLDTSKPVRTIVGTSWLPQNRLFTSGDIDGQGRQVRLQHALDVHYHDGLLYVADTYNNKIKVIDPRQSTCQTLVGTNKAGTDDSPAQFNEPEGLAYARGKLYVADTNNHLIRTIDLVHGNKVTTLEIAGLKPPDLPAPATKPNFAGASRVELSKVGLKPRDGKIHLQVALELPFGNKINADAPLRYFVESEAKEGPIGRDALGKLTDVQDKTAKFDIELPVTLAAGSEKLTVSVAFYYCSTGSEGVCKAGTVTWIVPITLTSADGSANVQLPFRVQ